MRRTIPILSLIFALAAGIQPLSAQEETPIVDGLSIFILDAVDGEKVQSALLARAAAEDANLALHNICKEANIEYHDINIQLDKYTRFFNVLDVTLETLQTGVIAVNTYKNTKATLASYTELLDDFHEKCLKHGDIVTTDAQIIASARTAIQKIMVEVEDIFDDIACTATDLFGGCTAEEYAALTNHTQSCLERINKVVNTTYMQTWNYIKMRTGYFKKEVYMARTKEEVLEDAFGRWQLAIQTANQNCGIIIKD